jgi:hypothetical protein
MGELLFVIVIGSFIGLLVCVPTAVTLWAVLGETHFLFRLAGLLFSISAVGAFAANNLTGHDAIEKCGLAVWLLFLAACLWVFKHWLARAAAASIMVGTLGLVIRVAGPRFVDPQSYAAAAIAIPLAASLILTFRLLGFRFVRLTGNVSDTEIEIGTGMNFDAWLKALRAADAQQMTRAQIVSFLRERGVPFTYQRLITDAYEMSIGRRILSLGADGAPQTVVAHDQLGKAARERDDLARSRWSLSQLMVLSLVAAGLFALARIMALQVPDALQLGIVTMVSLCCVLIAVPVLAAELSVQPHWLNRVIYLLVASIVAVAVPHLLGVWTLGIWFSLAAASVWCYLAWLVGAVILVRHHGYRIVLVGRPQLARLAIART